MHQIHSGNGILLHPWIVPGPSQWSGAQPLLLENTQRTGTPYATSTVTALDRMLAPTAPDRMLQLLHPIAGHSTTEWLVF
jgi:hypothetical protein